MRILALSIACVLAALSGCTGCSGDTPPEIDADPRGPKCPGDLYDLCLEEHDCMSNSCPNFASAGIQVCSQACTDTMPCPDSPMGPATCDMGHCRPPVANHCHL
jgi:hypothetical protein